MQGRARRPIHQGALIAIAPVHMVVWGVASGPVAIGREGARAAQGHPSVLSLLFMPAAIFTGLVGM